MLPLRPEAFHFASESWQGYSEEEGKPHPECPALVSGGRPPRNQPIHNLLSSAHANKLMHNDSLPYSPTRRQPLSQNNVPREGTKRQTGAPSKGKISLHFLSFPHLFLWPILSTQLNAVENASLGPALRVLVSFPLSIATLFRDANALRIWVS